MSNQAVIKCPIVVNVDDYCFTTHIAHIKNISNKDCPLSDIRVGPTGVDSGGLVGQEGLREVKVHMVDSPGVRVLTDDLEDS